MAEAEAEAEVEAVLAWVYEGFEIVLEPAWDFEWVAGF